MDWSKAKTILIIALLISNLFMGSLYLSRLSDREDELEAAAQNVVRYAQAQGIKVDAELPAEERRMPVLFVYLKYGQTTEAPMHEYKGVPVEAAEGLNAEIIPESEGDTKGRLISASDALLKLLESFGNDVPQGLEISEVSLIYWLNPLVTDGSTLEDTAVPAWKFVTNMGDYRVEAFVD